MTREWKKVLYESSDFPDDYVPPTFLKDLRKNVNVRYYTLSEIVISSLRVTDQVCLVILLVLLYHCLQNESGIRVDFIYAGVIGVTSSLYVLVILNYPKGQGWTLVKSTFICLVGGFTVSPILRTLTETISTDTVYSMVTVMMLIHLFFFDYGVESAIISQPISLNASIFAGVCLASRLSTSSAFILLIFSADIFVLLSLLRASLRSRQSKLSWTIFLVSISGYGLLSFKEVIWVASFAIVLVLLNLAFPYLFYRLQYMKENIYGPWDEAVIKKTRHRMPSSTSSTSS